MKYALTPPPVACGVPGEVGLKSFQTHSTNEGFVLMVVPPHEVNQGSDPGYCT